MTAAAVFVVLPLLGLHRCGLNRDNLMPSLHPPLLPVSILSRVGKAPTCVLASASHLKNRNAVACVKSWSPFGGVFTTNAARQLAGLSALQIFRLWLGAVSWFVVTIVLRSSLALATGVVLPSEPRPDLRRNELAVRFVLWFSLFSLAAMLAGAETAITTLWPWKIKQLASDEKGGMFDTLQQDITKVLTTILVGVTFCTVYGTALATDIAIQLIGREGVGLATIVLTLVTLFFGEIVPKSLAVANAEWVARATLPLINVASTLLYPLGRLISTLTQGMLHLLGLDDSSEEQTVTEPELRMMVTGAKQSGAVELYEQDMIEGVLDLDQSIVAQMMQPRVDVVAIRNDATLRELVDLSLDYKYSRIPVYNQTIDQITGVVLSRELLECVAQPDVDLKSRCVSSIMEDTAFVPESMSAMNALKLMRRQRLHMLVVVDEFGGTSGIVTLEDILETLVGKIYDEDDDDEVKEEIESIIQNHDGSWSIEGMAELVVASSRLRLELPEVILADFTTLSGFLCSQAGEIPAEGDQIVVDHIRFEILEADERRILSVLAVNRTAETNGDIQSLNSPDSVRATI
eukprot:CAMPEP_0119325514 /NCGR_PEP_ID=MMETSP1333-20130426/66003_1 /TAXON_ID=418940 /ORGANISM="Scyphosphaera apsteinii, Strain RCC1455" /LENGTH=574 /DNA_ID=CAMNT_0007333527 /DNA_START=38 /DNA_END=1762 /DNA_ORIENTATION=-